ncbi:hydrolase, partial [Paraphoma chrysanthemicola]
MATHQTATTKFVSVNGLNIAYRRFGKASAIPLVYIPHFRASMDVTDPKLMNNIAKNREVILIDNAGIGHSEGTVPESIDEIAGIIVGVLAALKISKVDVLGFSMGGMVVQYLGFHHPDLVNKSVVAGSQIAIGEGVAFAPAEILQGGGAPGQPSWDAFAFLFFNESEASVNKGKDWFKRLFERQVQGEERKEFLDGQGIMNQITAMTKWATDAENFNRLSTWKAPVLVTNGNNDIMAPTVNSYILHQKAQNAELHLYPNSGHGHLWQEPDAYADLLQLFLE